MDGHSPAMRDNFIYGGRKRSHVIPMPMADRDRLDLTQRNSEVCAIAKENRALRAGIEQQGVPHTADLGYQSQTEAEIGAEQHFAGDDGRAAANDIRALG